MYKPNTFLAQLTGLVALLCIPCLAKQNNTFGQEPTQFSPRDFCMQLGGAVSETADPGIYICRYAKRQRCVLSDTVRGLSRIVDCRTTREITVPANAQRSAG